MFTKNLMSLKENIIYQSNYESFFADVMTMDLVTKEIKIFMNDKSNKVKFMKNNGYNIETPADAAKRHLYITSCKYVRKPGRSPSTAQAQHKRSPGTHRPGVAHA